MAAIEHGLPTAADAERFVLGSILLDDTLFVQAAGALELDDFSLEKHRRIFKRMGDLQQRGEKIDRVTLYHELAKHKEAESCDGLSYLVTLDDGLPQIPNLDGYIRLVKDKALMRRIIFASQHLMNRALVGEEEPSRILSDASETWLKLSQAQQKSALLAPAEIFEQAGGVGSYLDGRNRVRGLKTGFPVFDALTGGLAPGKLYILGARPRMGKTAFMLNMTENISIKAEEHATLIFSLEMCRQSLLDRLICSRARVNTKRFEGGHLTSDEHRRVTRAAGEIATCDKILIDDKATTSIREIHTRIRQEQVKRSVGLVIIDYLQLLIGGDVKYRVAEASKISRDLKLLAKDCQVPVLAASQLSRECDTRNDPRPQLSDLRESGAIEQDADVVAFLFREEVYKPDRDNLRGLADLIIAKQRSGPEGTIPLTWLKEIVRFESRITGHGESRLGDD
jgi:replicative DNA helicase